MSTRVEEVMIMETQRSKPRSFPFAHISWGAIFGGVAVGIATYMLLALLGVAAGLSVVDPQSGDATGGVPMMTGIWTGLCMLISAFVGGYVAARMSGLRRRSDGLFHGFVAWGVTMLLFAYLTTTAVGSVLGGTFGVLGQSMQGVAQGVAQRADTPGGAGPVPSGQELRSQAERIADQAAAMVKGQQVPAKAREAAAKTVSALAMASWWLFAGVLLSMVLGIWGGVLGARMGNRRRETVSAGISN